MRLLLSCALLVGLASALPWDSPEEDERASATTCACGWTNKGRIVGGKEVQKNAYPLIVAIQYNNGTIFCGGTIITPWHVLTAAHCTYGEKTSDLFVNAGAHTRKGKSEAVYPVAKYVNHEKFVNSILIYDISLLVTARQMTFNQNVGPACLPTSRINLEGQSIKALGWGRTSTNGSPSGVLREVDLRVIGFEQCYETWKHNIGPRPRKETNMCTLDTRKDTCKGDSGGPLIWLDPATNRYTLVALVSYGGACGGHQAAPNTDVGAFLPWINKNIAATKPGAKTCTKA